eukprot:765104-Hanusia_phi.AAC.14
MQQIDSLDLTAEDVSSQRRSVGHDSESQSRLREQLNQVLSPVPSSSLLHPPPSLPPPRAELSCSCERRSTQVSSV